MGSLGETLRQARLGRGASLADAEQDTRIRRKYLEALEAEDWGALPSTVYTRGFIRTYARYLGLDPESTLDLYAPARAREERPALHPATPQLSAARPLSASLFMAVAGAILVVMLLGYLWTQYTSFVESLSPAEPGGSARATATLARPGAVASPVVTATAAPAAGPAPAAIPTPERGIVLDVRVTERTWIEVWTDGTPQLQSTLPAGATRGFQANQTIKVRVGNAGGVAVTVNGEPKGALGDRNQVKEFEWSR